MDGTPDHAPAPRGLFITPRARSATRIADSGATLCALVLAAVPGGRVHRTLAEARPRRWGGGDMLRERGMPPLAASAAGVMNLSDRVRAYVCHVISDCPADRITSATRFESGDRHAVYRVSYRDAVGDAKDVVVRISIRDEPAERVQAELEAAVLERLKGIGAPRLYDFRSESPWFRMPSMCMQFIEGEQRDVALVPAEELESLGAVVASVHNLAVDDLAESFPGARTLTDYVEERLELNASYLPRLREPLPTSVRSRVDRAFSLVATSRERPRRAAYFRVDDRLVLLHGDVASANIVWSHKPVLIDWEYARMGDPADEVAYIFGQHGLTAPQRAAFWAGYRSATTHPQLDQVSERVRWWEPVLLLGSALWWLERWSWCADAAAAGRVDPSAPKPPAYYLDHVIRRLDRFDEALDRA